MKLIYTRPDGGVSIVAVVPKANIEVMLGSISDKEYLDHVHKVSIPEDATNIREIEDADIPENREFRESWVDVNNSGQLSIDLLKAKDLQLAAMRVVRNAQLVSLDADSLKAMETKSDDSGVLAQKQALRDATEALKDLDVTTLTQEEGIAQIKALAVLPVISK